MDFEHDWIVWNRMEWNGMEGLERNGFQRNEMLETKPKMETLRKERQVLEWNGSQQNGKWEPNCEMVPLGPGWNGLEQNGRHGEGELCF